MNHSTLDAGIPLLTEIIASAELGSAGEASASISLPHTSASDETQLDDESGMSLSHRDWARLEHELHEKILCQLQDRIDLVIEQRVRDSLADVLQTAVEGMAQQIKAGLHQTLDEVISRAVALELSKFQKTTD